MFSLKVLGIGADKGSMHTNATFIRSVPARGLAPSRPVRAAQTGSVGQVFAMASCVGLWLAGAPARWWAHRAGHHSSTTLRNVVIEHGAKHSIEGCDCCNDDHGIGDWRKRQESRATAFRD